MYTHSISHHARGQFTSRGYTGFGVLWTESVYSGYETWFSIVGYVNELCSRWIENLTPRSKMTSDDGFIIFFFYQRQKEDNFAEWINFYAHVWFIFHLGWLTIWQRVSTLATNLHDKKRVLENSIGSYRRWTYAFFMWSTWYTFINFLRTNTLMNRETSNNYWTLNVSMK